VISHAGRVCRDFMQTNGKWPWQGFHFSSVETSVLDIPDNLAIPQFFNASPDVSRLP